MDRDTTLSLITALAEALADPRQHVERTPYWDTNRNRKTREWRTVQPGLLDQLYQSAVEPVRGQTEPGPRPVPASRPPLALEALSTFHQVEFASARWVRSLRTPLRDTVQGNIRALVGAAPRLDDDTLTALVDEMRTWHRWASVATGWTAPLYQPHVRCPACEQVGKLRVNLSAQVATCRSCRATWAADDGSIFVLGEYIRAACERIAA